MPQEASPFGQSWPQQGSAAGSVGERMQQGGTIPYAASKAALPVRTDSSSFPQAWCPETTRQLSPSLLLRLRWQDGRGRAPGTFQPHS